MKPPNLFHALILALAASAALFLAVIAGHAALTLPAFGPGVLSALLSCASLWLYRETFRALHA